MKCTLLQVMAENSFTRAVTRLILQQVGLLAAACLTSARCCISKNLCSKYGHGPGGKLFSAVQCGGVVVLVAWILIVIDPCFTNMGFTIFGHSSSA